MDETQPRQKLETPSLPIEEEDALVQTSDPSRAEVLPASEVKEVAALDAHKKLTWKERIKEEIVEVGIVIVYLAVAFFILQTFKCATVLGKTGENHFLTAYTTAAISSVVLGKFVFVLEKMKISKMFEHRPLIVSVVYKSILFTILINFALHFEDRLVHGGGAHLWDQASNPLTYWLVKFAQELAFFVTFFIFFTFREIGRVLGKGSLAKLFFVPRN